MVGDTAEGCRASATTTPKVETVPFIYPDLGSNSKSLIGLFYSTEGPTQGLRFVVAEPNLQDGMRKGKEKGLSSQVYNSLCITLVAADLLRAGMPLHIRLPGAGFARHRLPHFTVLRCLRLCPSLLEGAPHDCVELRLHSLQWQVVNNTPRHSVAVAAPFREL